ncbi:MAG TPA: carboxypeptidase regulatory-like domain-containing protein, partial [Candidatus Sulfotelmatobacter sp.]|nr:carboxypeptidase regulatory-like domain-containing protein [Candidatus Sulfotelmatobacter sp.]
MKVEGFRRFVLIAILSLTVGPFTLAQNTAAPSPAAQAPTQSAPGENVYGSLRGQVTDPSGAAIAGATVIMTPATGAPVVVQSNAQGMYEFKTLVPGKYVLTVAATGFTMYENDGVTVANQALRLNVPLAISVEEEKVSVSDTAPTVDVNPSNNAGAITISGKELEALPDDPDELLSDLQALAGPSAGPNGGQMYIDGFTAGELPPKSSIREIRINQNPFSAEYDQLGYGRIEIFTKPGTDKYHGQLFADGNDSTFNAPNPFAGVEPPYHSTQFNGNIGGPVNKSASFFFNFQRRDIDELSAINAVDPTTGDTFASSIANPRQRTNLSPRLDWALTPNNTLTARYQYYRDTETGNLDSPLSLSTQAYYSQSTEDTVQISDTQVFGTKIVNETRFQYLRDNSLQNPTDTNPATNVLGSFTGGGFNSGNLNDLQNAYEIQNYTSLIHGNHTLKFGGRVRVTQDTNYSTSGFNGLFTFPTFAAFQAAEQYVKMNPGQTASGATQLSIIDCLLDNSTYVPCSPNAAAKYFDIEPYLQDDWRVKPNLTLSFGLRFEAQNVIHDHDDWAPRLGFAWGVRGRSNPPIV